MIYFLINNTFHFHYINSIIDDLKEHELGLIQVPYSLDPITNDQRFKFVTILERLKHTKEYLVDWPNRLIPSLISNRKKITESKIKIQPKKTDILFVFTEEELLNLIIVKGFKEVGAQIYLIEDGAAAYVYYSIDSDPISKRAKLFKHVIRFLYGLKGYYPFTINGYICQRISDSYYSGICYFFPIKIKRSFPVYQIRKNIVKKQVSKNKNALFLTQPIYMIYLSFDEYLINLNNIVNDIHGGFQKLYIKFHPDETRSGLFLKIKEHLSHFENIIYIESNSNIEDLISEIDINYVISYNSSALMNLTFYGIEPIYLYHLYSFLEDNSTLQLTNYLKTLNYNFPKSLNDVKPGYQSNLLDKINQGSSISELIN